MLVRDKMTLNPVTATPDMSLTDALRLMNDRKIRRLPVVDSHGRLAGIISDRDLAFQLALTSQLQFAGLRGFVPDERLFLYIPVSLAVSERICPLVMVGSSLKIASAFIDPDLSYLEQRFPNLDVELVLAARGEILAALAHIARGR